jgi:hypothetical protein
MGLSDLRFQIFDFRFNENKKGRIDFRPFW